MLKKLVKYGNSNALILDKAILELLNIEEGAVIKMTTDGTSIIITPQVKVTTEKVNEPFTHNQASMEAFVKEGVKALTGIGANEREKIEKEWLALTKKYQDLSMRVCQSPHFVEQVTQLSKQFGTSSPEYIKAYTALRYKVSPELLELETAMTNFASEHKLSAGGTSDPLQNLSEEQKTALRAEFAAVHKQNSEVYAAYGELLNNPEYQNKAQLIAEKYAADQDSVDYIRAMDALNDAYLPEYRRAQNKIKAISDKYASIAKK